MKIATKYKRYSFILTHFRRQTDYLSQAIAEEDLNCSVCFELIEQDTTYWYPMNKGLNDHPKYICYRCKHMFESTAIPNKPYWLMKPTIGATDNIRTTDDRGIREFQDGTFDEWNAIWANDLAGARFP